MNFTHYCNCNILKETKLTITSYCSQVFRWTKGNYLPWILPVIRVNLQQEDSKARKDTLERVQNRTQIKSYLLLPRIRITLTHPQNGGGKAHFRCSTSYGNHQEFSYKFNSKHTMENLHEQYFNRNQCRLPWRGVNPENSWSVHWVHWR